MKNFNKLAIFTFAMFGFAAAANAQSTATATSSATIVTPIAITKNVDMNFGNVAATSTLGTIVLSNGGTPTASGGATVVTTNSVPAAAKFTVTGQAGYTYAISLPTGDYTINGASATAAESMIVNAFTSSLGTAGTGTLTGGSQEVTVGATLNVKANQKADTYTNGTGFAVTVNYN